MDEAAVTALLSILSVLVGVLVYVVRTMTLRTDRLLAARDKQVERTIDTLKTAVESFSMFERASSEMHRALIDRLDALAQAQKETIEVLKANGKEIERRTS